MVASRPLADELADRAKAVYSTYFLCSTAGQQRADEIFRQVYVPALNQVVSEGKIHSWTWFAHVVGGKYRRLLTYSGRDHKTLLDGVEAYTSAIRADHPELAEEFSSICGTDDDYL